MSRRLFLGGVVVFLFVIGLLPLLSMLERSLFVDGHFTLASYHEVLRSSQQWRLMGHSLLLSALVTLLTIVVGVPLGLLFEKTDLPFRRLLTLLFTVPLLVPPYIFAVSWSDLLSPGSFVARFLGEGWIAVADRLLFGLPGCTFVLFSIYLPIPILLTIVSLRSLNPRLEEAARIVTDWRGVLTGVTLPLIFPTIILSGILVFLLTLAEFTVANYLRYDVYAAETFIQFSAFYDFGAATAAAAPLLGVTLLLLWVEARFLRDKTYRLRPDVEERERSPIALGKWRILLFIPVVLAALLIVIVPILTLLIESAAVENYIEAIHRAGGSLLRSLLYALIGATLLTLLGFLLGYLIEKRALKLWRWVDSVTIFLFVLPGTVLGIGLISLWNTPWSNIIYATPLIIILGYLAKYSALSSRITITQLAGISPSMEEAAQMAGAGWFRRMALIVAPLSRYGLAAAWLVSYIFILRDTGITMLVYPPGYETLPVRIFTLMANGSSQLVAALSVLMIILAVLPAGAVYLLWQTKKRKRKQWRA